MCVQFIYTMSTSTSRRRTSENSKEVTESIELEHVDDATIEPIAGRIAESDLPFCVVFWLACSV